MSSPLNVLFVDDSAEDVQFLLGELRRGGGEIHHKQVDTATAMTCELDSQRWDIIIANCALAEFSGMAALALARAWSKDIPFILISDSIGDESAVLAMKAGANDYFFKNNLSRLGPAVRREVQEAVDRRAMGIIAQELEVSELRYRRMFETTNDGILILDAETAKVLDANRFIIDLLGYPREHLLGKELWEIGVFKDAEASKAAMASLQKRGGIRYENLPLEHHDGGQIPVEFVSNVYLEGTRNVIQCNIRDITQRKLAEKDLRRTQELLQSVLRASTAGVMVFQTIQSAVDGTIVDFEFKLVNPAAERMLNRRGEDLIGKRLLSALPGNRPSGLFDLYVEVVTTGQPLNIEKYYNYDGLASWFHVAAVRVGDGFSVTFDDITDRKIADEELRDSEERFRLLVEGVQEYGIFLLDCNGYVISWNAGAERIKGYTAEQAIGRNFSMFYPPEDVASGKPGMQLKQAAETGRWEDEGWRVRADGTRFWANVMITALRDPAGGLRGFSKLVRDVSGRRGAEEALRESEGRLRAIVETAVDGIITIDAWGKITSFNPAAVRLFGYTPEEVFGRNVKLLMPAPYHREHDTYLHNYLTTGSRKVIGVGREVVGLRKDGSTFPMDLAVSETFLGERRIFTGIVRDISERNRALKELAETKEAAEAASRSKSEFLANMSHEIRTPMTAILGFANMVVHKDQDKAGRVECAQIIRRNALHLLELINEILDLSKIEALQMSVECVPCDLLILLSEIFSLMRPRAVEKGLEFEVSFDGMIPRQLQTDSLRLRQILVNLLGNAVKFTDSGKISVRICDEGAGTANIALRIDVCDTGIGMSQEQLSRLFRPFAQADESITRKFGGTGLGLAISARLAKLLNGDISVITEQGIGSTFTLRIGGGPSAGIEMASDLTESMLPKSMDGLAQPFVALRGRILLVDDGRDNQRLLRMLLADAGAEVILAENGRIAVDIATNQPFDLILMDMQMPVMDGYAATKELRNRGLTIPIIALTAHAMSDDRARCMACGCTYYLSKPIREETLLKTVGHHLGNGLSRVPVMEVDKPVTIGSLPPQDSGSSSHIKSRLSGDPRIRKILPEFVDGLPDKVRQMLDLMQSNDLAELQNLIHQLRGASGGYGFDAVTDPARKAEESIKLLKSPEIIAAEINSLIEILRRIEGYDESKSSVDAREPAK
jgi:two-component system CheB/CheR fusion protein